MKDACKNNLMNITKCKCGFWQGYGTQNCLLAIIEKLRKIRDKKAIFVAVLTDLSKAVDCISHNLLIAKLPAYSFDRKSLICISAYLKSRKQKTRMGSAFEDCLNILFGVPRGCILGPMLFLIFLSDLFYIFITISTTRAMLMIPLLTFIDRITLKLLIFKTNH